MHATNIVSSLLALTSVANAYTLYFYVEPIKATDFTVEPQSHQVDFKICAPNNFYEQGGNGAVNCSLSWNTTEPPTCYVPCPGSSGNGGYSARITPGSYQSAENFSIDVFQSYVYELTNRNEATIPIAPGVNESSYACTYGSQSTVCSTGEQAKGFNVTEQQRFGGSMPEGSSYC